MEKLIMMKYGELSTKKDNIKVFIEKLSNNITKKLKNYDIKIQKNKVRMFIDIKNYDEDKIVNLLKEVFGIHSIVICYKVDKNLESIESVCCQHNWGEVGGGRVPLLQNREGGW